MSQILRPDGDDSQSGSWIPEPSDTSLWDVIDEAEANDADYVWHDAVGGGEYFEVTLSNPNAAPGAGAGTIRWRVGRIDGGKITNVDVRLYQGAGWIATWPSHALTDVFTTHEENVPQEIMDAVTDWNDVIIRIQIYNTSGGGKSSDPAISWIEFEVPDAAEEAAYVPKVIMID